MEIFRKFGKKLCLLPGRSMSYSALERFQSAVTTLIGHYMDSQL